MILIFYLVSYDSETLDSHNSASPSVSNFRAKASMDVKPSVRDFDLSSSENEQHQSLSFSTIMERSLPSVSNFQTKASMEVRPSVREIDNLSSNKEQNQNFSLTRERSSAIVSDSSSDSDELFSKVLASYLKNLSRRYKIKAKVEMMQIVEKYIDIEENEGST